MIYPTGEVLSDTGTLPLTEGRAAPLQPWKDSEKPRAPLPQQFDRPCLNLFRASYEYFCFAYETFFV